MIFREGTEGASLQQTHRKIEARRAELAFVIAKGTEIHRCHPLPVAAHGIDRPVDNGIATAAALVDRTAAVADAGDHQAMVDAMCSPFICRQPAE